MTTLLVEWSYTQLWDNSACLPKIKPLNHITFTIVKQYCIYNNIMYRYFSFPETCNAFVNLLMLCLLQCVELNSHPIHVEPKVKLTIHIILAWILIKFWIFKNYSISVYLF